MNNNNNMESNVIDIIDLSKESNVNDIIDLSKESNVNDIIDLSKESNVIDLNKIALRNEFLYTSGYRSPYHQHDGFGLVVGLEGEVLEAVDKLEDLAKDVIGVARSTAQGNRDGWLVGWVGKRNVYCGYVKCQNVREPKGARRPTCMVTGGIPSATLLLDTRIEWRFMGRDRKEVMLPSGKATYKGGVLGRIIACFVGVFAMNHMSLWVGGALGFCMIWPFMIAMAWWVNQAIFKKMGMDLPLVE